MGQGRRLAGRDGSATPCTFDRWGNGGLRGKPWGHMSPEGQGPAASEAQPCQGLGAGAQAAAMDSCFSSEPKQFPEVALRAPGADYRLCRGKMQVQALSRQQRLRGVLGEQAQLGRKQAVLGGGAGERASSLARPPHSSAPTM